MANWEEKTFADGRTFVSADILTCGDYGGAGSVGRANIDALLAEHEKTTEHVGNNTWRTGELLKDGWTDYTPDAETTLIIVSWPYSTEQAWVIRNDDTKEMLEKLDDYPAIDDEEISRVEMDWENEAWDSWLKSDLMRAACKVDETLEDPLDEMSNDDMWECYRTAMEATNTYPEPEYNGVHIDVDRITPAFVEAVKEKLS